MDLASWSARAVRALPDVRGKTHLGWQAMRACERLSSLEGRLEVDLDDGSHLTLPRNSQMSWATAFNGGYDTAMQRHLRTYIKPASVVMDIGAALGLWTVPLARYARANGASVWAVEPHPNNQQWLNHNVSANGLGEVVTVLPCALGNETGTVAMQLCERETGDAAGNAAVQVQGTPETSSSVAVSVRRLDDLPRARPVSLMKVDVEGFEVRVLMGSQRLIREDRPVIYGEFGREWLDLRGEDLGAYLATLEDIGYSVFSMEALRSHLWRPVDGYRLRPVVTYSGEEDLLLLPGPQQ